MKARDVLDLCHHSGVWVEREDGNVTLTALAAPCVPEGLTALCREHKPALLELLGYEEQADALLLESTRLIGAAWASGCDLDTPEWDAYEQTLHEAYWSENLEQVKSALVARERYALGVFSAYRSEARHV